MARRITAKRVRNFLLATASTGVVIFGLFSLIFSLGVATLEGNYTSNTYCGGDEVCWLELEQLCFNEDVFVYPMDGAEIINAQPSDQINEVHLYRSWGEGWREFKLNETCKGTWCGAPSAAVGAEYVAAFRKDKCYDLRIEVYKPLDSTITWEINPTGVWLPYGVSGTVRNGTGANISDGYVFLIDQAEIAAYAASGNGDYNFTVYLVDSTDGGLFSFTQNLSQNTSYLIFGYQSTSENFGDVESFIEVNVDE